MEWVFGGEIIMSWACLVRHIADEPSLVDKVPSKEIRSGYLTTAITSNIKDESTTINKSRESSINVPI